MAPPKRQSHRDDRERDGPAPGNESNRSLGPSKQTMIRAFRNMIEVQGMNVIFESFFRRVPSSTSSFNLNVLQVLQLLKAHPIDISVREETQSAFRRCLCPRQSLNQTRTCEERGRVIQLHFDKKLPLETFTHSKIVAEDGTLLQISLRDAQNSIVRDSPLSSITVELCVLNGDFSSHGGREDWTGKEFDASILHKTRKGGQLLAGDKSIKLTNGVGYITQVHVTDISKWARLGKFRLGAKVVESAPDEPNIREGVSEAFKVKDKRGKSYPRRGIQSLKDKVRRLRRIPKDGKRKTQKQVKACAVHEQDDTGRQANAGEPYVLIGSLDSERKLQCAYENLEDQQRFDFPTINHDFCVASTSTWHIGEAAHHEQIGIVELAELAEGPLYSDADERFFSDLQRYLGESSWLHDSSHIPFGDEAECSYRSSAVNKSSKGKGKAVWNKIRNAFKVNMLCGAMRKAKL